MQLDAYFNSKPVQKKPNQRGGRVEPYEGSNSLAKFRVPEVGSPPRPYAAHSTCEPIDEAVDVADVEGDQFEYLWQDANQPALEDDDTDGSCLTFDDESVPDDDVCMSPVVETQRPPAKRPKASECPVYAGPELWYDDDDFIE